MHRLLVIILTLAVSAGLAFSQTWVYDGDFVEGPAPHGLVIDEEGWIWYGWYAYSDTFFVEGPDTIPIAPIYCVNADGEHAPFSPIRTLTVEGETDTMDSYCRGLSIDHEGNIIFVGNQVMYRINRQTGEGMTKYLYPYASGSLTSAGVDDNGFVYVTKVVPGGDPLVILDEDFEEYSRVQDSCRTIQRSVITSPDGKDVFVGTIYSGKNGVRHFYSEDGPDGLYEEIDTLGTILGDGSKGSEHLMWGQSIDWDRNDPPLMWVGTYWDVRYHDFTGWYALDPTQDWAIVDTVGHNNYDVIARGTIGTDYPWLPPGGSYYSPRHVAWSLDGKTMYTADYDGGVIKKWTNAAPKGPGSDVFDPELLVSIDYDDVGRPIIAVEFDLQQNYPNPFNPTTTIPFDINKNFHVKLVVYNMLGQNVATLVDKQMGAGHYEFQFDGSNLASGTYFYQLSVDGQLATKQMLLIK